MAALSANADVKTAPRGTTKAYKVETDEIYGHALMGLDDSTGYAQPWTNEAGLMFLGLAKERVTGDLTASPIPECSIEVGGAIIRNVTVTGVSAVTHIGDLVYCATDNYDDMTLTPTSDVNAIGRVVRWHSSSTCDVELFTPTEYLNQNAALVIASLTDNSGGTASDTLADVIEANNAGSADRVPTENAIASLAAKVNAIIAALSGGN